MKQVFKRIGVLIVALTMSAVTIGEAKPESQLQEVNSVYIPIILGNMSRLEPTVFGVQMYGGTGSNTKYNQALIDSGASWLRVNVRWDTVEPVNSDPKDYHWGGADRSVAAARPEMGGLNIIALIEKNPEWAAPYADGPIEPDKLDDFADFVGALVERYDGDRFNDAPGSPVVDYWEFYNEPDAGGLGGGLEWGHAGAEYAQMLTTVYPVVKAANPKAQVVFGGIAYDWFEDQNGPFVREFLDEVLTNCDGDCFDVMNFHAYAAFAPFWTTHGPGLLEKAQAVRGKLIEYGYSAKPIIITEAGWHSNSPNSFPSNLEYQARYVVELFTQSLAADVSMMTWWMLYDPGGFAWDNGLVTNADPPVKKPSFDAFRTIVDVLGTAQFDRVLTLAETGHSNMEAYRFEDGAKTIYVAWLDQTPPDPLWLDPAVTLDPKPLVLEASQVTVRDIYGTGQVVLDGADGQLDGRVTVPIGGQPSYVEVSK